MLRPTDLALTRHVVSVVVMEDAVRVRVVSVTVAVVKVEVVMETLPVEFHGNFMGISTMKMGNQHEPTICC
jgi:hypothetical protein